MCDRDKLLKDLDSSCRMWAKTERAFVRTLEDKLEREGALRVGDIDIDKSKEQMVKAKKRVDEIINKLSQMGSN